MKERTTSRCGRRFRWVALAALVLVATACTAGRGSATGPADGARFRLLQLREVLDSSSTDRFAMAARPFTTGVIRRDDPYRRDPRFTETPPDRSGDMVTFEDFDGDRLYDPSSEPKVLLGPVRFSGRDVSKAIAEVISMPSAPPRWQVEFVLNQEGTRVFRAVTSELVGRQLAMVVNGVVLSAPTIQATITSGRGTITGRFTERQAKELAAALTQPVG